MAAECRTADAGKNRRLIVQERKLRAAFFIEMPPAKFIFGIWKWRGESLKFQITQKTRVQIAVLGLLIACVSVALIWNILELQQAIRERTHSYAADVTLQLADNVDDRISNLSGELNSIGDSLLQNDHIAQSKLNDFLLR